MDIGWDATGWAAAGSWATVAVYLLVLLYARQQVNEARRLREAELRPFVVVDFDVFSRRPLIFLTISNLGRTLARNVKLTFSPELSSSLEDEHDTLSSVRLLTEGMPTLAPGKHIPILFDSFITRGNDRPDAYKVSLTYDGEGRRHYQETILLDLGVYRNIQYITTHDVHDVHAQVKKIAETLGKWTSTWGGVKVWSRDDERQQYREWKETQEARRGRAVPPTGGVKDSSGET